MARDEIQKFMLAIGYKAVVILNGASRNNASNESLFYKKIQHQKLSFVLCGFGVGLSWGTMHLETDAIVCPELIEV